MIPLLLRTWRLKSRCLKTRCLKRARKRLKRRESIASFPSLPRRTRSQRLLTAPHHQRRRLFDTPWFTAPFSILRALVYPASVYDKTVTGADCSVHAGKTGHQGSTFKFRFRRRKNNHA